ncbi:hypothetical protein [Burkholderia ubonensis]|uniref:hypothetical protein n=1 Tax=Burkholderia ubonensis TaxID=101571 RepID=UPI000AFC590F|nr:hypothetical protein [Burkholderia ubonensis]
MRGILVAVLAFAFGVAHAAQSDNEIAYGMFQDMPFPPGTDDNMCAVYSKAASQITEMRNDHITLAVALEDVGRIDVVDQRIVLSMMTRAAYSNQGRKAWKDPRSAEWSVMRKCTNWIYKTGTKRPGDTPRKAVAPPQTVSARDTGGPDLSGIKGGVNPRNNPALMTDTLDASMRANMQGIGQRGMDITNVCVGYARDYGMAALNAQIANYRNHGGAGGAAEASQTPQFQAYADAVSNAAYDYCARVGAKLGGQVSSEVIYTRK